MVDFMSRIREELRRYEDALWNDVDEFHSELNLTRNSFSDYIDRQIEYLRRIQHQYQNEFDYLLEENRKTCEENRQAFDRLCLAINQHDNQPAVVSKLIEKFEENFPMRPKMLKSIPHYHYEDIEIDDLIREENVATPRNSIDFSSEKKNENAELSEMLNIVYQVRYEHSYKPCLMCLNEDENSILIYCLSLDELTSFSLDRREISSRNYSLNEPILNLGYWSKSRLYYYSTRKNVFVLFRLNEEEKQIEIERQLNLIERKDHFINVHIYDDVIYFAYLTSSASVMLGKYHLESSSSFPSINLSQKLNDKKGKLPFKIVDFTVNSSYLSFLIQMKDEEKKFEIMVCDSEMINRIHSFDLVDANKPVSMICTMSNDPMKCLLYINDPDNRSIHCCTYQGYLVSVHVGNFAICCSIDGNLVLITKKDVRILDVQSYNEEKGF